MHTFHMICCFLIWLFSLMNYDFLYIRLTYFLDSSSPENSCSHIKWLQPYLISKRIIYATPRTLGLKTSPVLPALSCLPWRHVQTHAELAQRSRQLEAKCPEGLACPPCVSG